MSLSPLSSSLFGSFGRSLLARGGRAGRVGHAGRGANKGWSVRQQIGLARQLRRIGKMSVRVGPMHQSLRLVGGRCDAVVAHDKPVARVDEVCRAERGWPYDNPLPIGLPRLPARPDKLILPLERVEIPASRPIETGSLGQRLDIYA